MQEASPILHISIDSKSQKEGRSITLSQPLHAITVTCLLCCYVARPALSVISIQSSAHSLSYLMQKPMYSD